MNTSRKHRFLIYSALLCALALPGPSLGFAAELYYQVPTDGGTREAKVETASRDGVSYVPLGHLLRQLGGQAQVTSDRATADYGGHAALVELGQAVVSGSLSQFRLSRPVLEGGGDAWIAVDDVVPFFKQAFGVTATPVQAPAAPDENALLGAAPAPTTPPVSWEPTGPVVVVLDPGHGGDDVGARGQTLEEKAFTLALGQRVANALAQAQVQGVLTRKDDSAKPLLDRANVAIQQRGKAFVSLHAGAGLAESLHGVEIFYPTDTDLGDGDAAGTASAPGAPERYRYAREGRALAEAVAAAITGQEGIALRPLHPFRSPLLLRVPMPGLMIEAGYITNSADEGAMAGDAYQEKLAQAIAAGICRYLGLSTPATPAAPAPASAPTVPEAPKP